MDEIVLLFNLFSFSNSIYRWVISFHGLTTIFLKAHQDYNYEKKKEKEYSNSRLLPRVKTPDSMHGKSTGLATTVISTMTNKRKYGSILKSATIMIKLSSIAKTKISHWFYDR